MNEAAELRSELDQAEREIRELKAQVEAFKKHYEWYENAGSWSDVSLEPKDGCRWLLKPSEALEGERLSTVIDQLLNQSVYGAQAKASEKRVEEKPCPCNCHNSTTPKCIGCNCTEKRVERCGEMGYPDNLCEMPRDHLGPHFGAGRSEFVAPVPEKRVGPSQGCVCDCGARIEQPHRPGCPLHAEYR